MRREICRGCEGIRLEKFLDLGEMPLAGGFLPNIDAIRDEKRFPLPIHVCMDCGLVQILEVIDPEILFQNYSFSSSTVGPLVKHFEKYADWLKNELAPKSVVEFGCNDGILLAPLEQLGIRACGVDVSKNITEMARSRGLEVFTGYFDEKMAAFLTKRLDRVDAVIGSNAFAHNDRPEVILKAAHHVLKPGGYLCLEFMYAGDLLELLQWDTLYHEHLTFYCLNTLEVLLRRHGFHVVHAERLSMHGGSLRVVASGDPDELPRSSVAKIAEYENEKQLANPATWLSFGESVGRKIEVVRRTVDGLSRGSRIWGYGAAGKATMWVNVCQMGYLEAVVDASPLRAGKLMPGTHTPIVFPAALRSKPPDYIFVSAWNYADVIRSKEDWFKGILIRPLPELRFF